MADKLATLDTSEHSGPFLAINSSSMLWSPDPNPDFDWGFLISVTWWGRGTNATMWPFFIDTATSEILVGEGIVTGGSRGYAPTFRFAELAGSSNITAIVVNSWWYDAGGESVTLEEIVFAYGNMVSRNNIDSWWGGYEPYPIGWNVDSATARLLDGAPFNHTRGGGFEAFSSRWTGFVIADSNVRLLTDADVQDLNEWELRLARNEIYARHGRLFVTYELRTHFEAQLWYNGRYAEIPEAWLSQIEIDNVALIQQWEAIRAR
jgi:hypothetical protein